MARTRCITLATSYNDIPCNHASITRLPDERESLRCAARQVFVNSEAYLARDSDMTARRRGDRLVPHKRPGDRRIASRAHWRQLIYRRVSGPMRWVWVRTSPPALSAFLTS